MTDLVAHPGPDWVVAEMPAGYQTRLGEIQRLLADLQQMGKYAGLLYQVGTPLADAIRDAFAAMKYDAEVIPDGDRSGVLVRLDAKRRLLLILSSSPATIQKKSPELGQAFQLLQDMDEATDRLVLVTNVDAQRPPSERADAVAPDALALLTRMGVSHVTGPTLFNLWKVSLQAVEKARAEVDRLHAGEAGPFEISPTLLRLSELRV